MTKEQIVAKIATFKKALENKSLPESAKDRMKQEIEKLEKELEQASAEEEKKQEKAQVVEKDMKSEIKDKISKFKNSLSNPSIPASAKESIKKQLESLEKQLSEIEQDAKKDEEEMKKEQKEVKEAVEKAKEEAKSEDSPKPEKIVVPKVKEKKREAKAKNRKKKLEKIMTELDELVLKNKKMKAKYEGKSVDLERDSKRHAKPFGWRFKGKHDYRIPDEMQIKRGKKTGRVYYEGRANRADIKSKGRVLLEKGGEIHDKQKDGQRFAKPKGWRWKDSAVEDGIITKAQLSKAPTKAAREKHPDYVYFETRVDKSDKNPSRRYKSL